MRVAKWGNSLAIRIPAALVRELGLKEGDRIGLRAASGGVLEIESDPGWTEALAAIHILARPLPPEYVFDREEANAR